MGLVYTAVVDSLAVTAQVALIEVSAPADGIVKLLSARVGQSSDAADAEAEMLSVSISRFTASGSGGTAAITADPHEVGFPAHGSTVDTGHTTLGTGENVIIQDAFNVQAGWLYVPTPGEEIIVSPSGIIGIVISAPADSLTVHASLTFEEIGG